MTQCGFQSELAVEMIDAFCDWLSATAISVSFQSSTWFVPLVQTVHILFVAVLLIRVFVLALRLIRLSTGGQPLVELVAGSMPPIWAALGVLLLTGALLTVTEPARELLNWAFRAKIILIIALAGLLLTLQHRNRCAANLDVAQALRRSTSRTIGVSLLLLGAAIVTAGRWIAYVV